MLPSPWTTSSSQPLRETSRSPTARLSPARSRSIGSLLLLGVTFDRDGRGRTGAMHQSQEPPSPRSRTTRAGILPDAGESLIWQLPAVANERSGDRGVGAQRAEHISEDRVGLL